MFNTHRKSRDVDNQLPQQFRYSQYEWGSSGTTGVVHGTKQIDKNDNSP